MEYFLTSIQVKFPGYFWHILDTIVHIAALDKILAREAIGHAFKSNI